MQAPPGPSRVEIWKMFDKIASTYDRVNRLISLGLDQRWRRKMALLLPQKEGMHILDCATGTGDQIIALLKMCPDPAQIIGIDLSEEMLQIAQRKLSPYFPQVTLQTASALELPFEDQSFDGVTISFGIRNVTETMTALKEFKRVLKPGGHLLILEGTTPKNRWLAKLHKLHMNKLLPRIGGAVSKNRSAYEYLNETIETFPQGEKFLSKLRAVGFNTALSHPLFGGVATIYEGIR